MLEDKTAFGGIKLYGSVNVLRNDYHRNNFNLAFLKAIKFIRA